MPSASKAEQAKNGYYSLAWHDLEWAADAIKIQLGIMELRPDTIVGVARGGMIPATMLAFKLGVFNVQSTRIQTYDTTHIDPPNPSWNRQTVLFVDDIYDSGETAKIIHATYPLAHIAIAFWKSSLLACDFTIIGGRHVPSCWVNFPWDSKDQLPVPTQPHLKGSLPDDAAPHLHRH